MVMDLVSPLFPSAFIIIVCLGSLSRSFTGVASGATRAALTQHFALASNAADISAKEGSQETLATMVGMMLGMLLAHVTMGNPLAVWFSFLALTLFHMYANYKAVRCLSLATLNTERGSILLQQFIRTGKVLSPQEVSKVEHVLPYWISSRCSKGAEPVDRQICLGIKVSSLTHKEMMVLSDSASSHYRKVKYLLLERAGVVNVIIHKDSTATDVLQSYIHALVLVNLMDRTKAIYAESRAWMNNNYTDFIRKLQQMGWRTERLLSPSVVWRANWATDPLDEKIQ